MENKSIIYKLLTVQDRPLYREIRLECLQNHPDNFGTSYEYEVKAEFLKFDKALLNPDSEDYLMGAFQGDYLVGICGFVREDRKKTHHRGEINQMYVREGFAGKGIGTKLLKCLLDKAFADESLEQIELGVVESNHSAIKLYQNLGFVQYGFLSNYFKTETASLGLVFMVLMRKRYQTFG